MDLEKATPFYFIEYNPRMLWVGKGHYISLYSISPAMGRVPSLLVLFLH